MSNERPYLTAMKLLTAAAYLLHAEGARNVSKGLEEVIVILAEGLLPEERKSMAEAVELICSGGQLQLVLKPKAVTAVEPKVVLN